MHCEFSYNTCFSCLETLKASYLNVGLMSSISCLVTEEKTSNLNSSQTKFVVQSSTVGGFGAGPRQQTEV